MTTAPTALLEGAVRTATPLALAALGELVVERSGVINIGLEGCIIAGALASVPAAAHGSIAGGFVSAAAGGTVVALVFALFAITLRCDQIITGTAVSMLGLGATGTLYRWIYGATGTALTLPTTGSHAVPALSRIPVIGPAFFDQPVPTYLVYALGLAIWWWLYRTHAGLALRAVGERPEAAAAAGISPETMQFGAVLFGGLLGGIAGGTLVLAQAGTFAEGMSEGRGFIAIAIVVLGRWRPAGVVLAALIFGAASALQYFFQAAGLQLPYQLFLATPYLLTLLALALVRGRALTPESLAKQETGDA